MVDTLVTRADETAIVAEHPEVAVVGDDTGGLDVAIALVAIIALCIHSQEIETVLLSPFLLCERGPVAPRCHIAVGEVAVDKLTHIERDVHIAGSIVTGREAC